ncbi:hypothetical protein P3W45_000640 [Vairimorpha bombi]
MAKATNKKKLKYKKMKTKYKAIIQTLLDSRTKLLNKIADMEIYYLDKIQFYKNKNDEFIKELEQDNENINIRYLELLKKTIKNDYNLQFKEDSEDEFLEKGQDENEVNSLKLSKFVEDDFYSPQNALGYKNDDDLKYRVHRLCFKYNTKISDAVLSSMPKTDLEDNEFCIRFDIENVDICKLNEKFKADNCVYPRANLPFEMYVGNRWEYETECNRLAWAFVSLNPVLLYGKKGLIQRAVDSYRNINKQNRNKKITRDDKFPSDFDKRKHASLPPSSVTINWVSKGIKKKCKIQVNIDNVNYEKIDEEFKNKYSVFMDDFDDRSFGLSKYESGNKDNELAVKIAFLNVENMSFWNAIKALDKTTVLKRAIEAYKAKKEEYPSSEDDTDASDLVSKALEEEHSEDLENFLLGA